MQEVTIIIPNYNGKSLLENCFRTLENQSYKDFKVLVVDNGSTDGSTDIKSDVLDVEWIALNENLGFCGAVNLAVQKERHMLFCLITIQRQISILWSGC